MEAVEGSEWRKEHSGARCFNQKVRYLDVACSLVVSRASYSQALQAYAVE
jgi:hypothetical protein